MAGSRRRPTVGIVDLLTPRPRRSPYARVMIPNFASIMPQAIAVWAEQQGCRVHYGTYTGVEDLRRRLVQDVDILFVCAFTSAAYLAYGLSHLYRRRGAVTVLGGPHARAYPDDAARHFDYVLGFTDRELVQGLLRHVQPQSGKGLQLAAPRQPDELPGVRERWKYVRATLDKAPFFLRAVPMLGSLGCPYRCSFCVDAEVEYQPLAYDRIREDLAFLRRKLPRPLVGWHDPNFAVRFDDYLGLIEEAVPPGSVRFVSESSLSILGGDRLARLQRNGFIGLLVGIESWFGFNGKARQGANAGAEKMRAVADQVDRISRHIPYTQANFVLGLDEDVGPEPFDLTRAFVDRAPAAYPAFSLFTAFGRSSPLNAELERAGRVRDIPFPLLDCASLLNVQPRNYGWEEIYGRVADLLRYSYAPQRSRRRFSRNPHAGPIRWATAIRSAVSRGRAGYYEGLRERLRRDRGFRAFCEGESGELPDFLCRRIVSELGPFRELLPAPLARRLRIV
jgi:hypothetical protein